MMNRSLLAQASYDAMFTEVKLKDGKGSGYGLGVFVGERDGHRVVFHDGEVSGFVSANMVLPNDKIAVTVLTNEDASSAAGTLAQQIVPLVLAGASAAAVDDSSATKAAEARALAIFTGLQEGKIDRSQLTQLASDYFTQEALNDFAWSLKPLGTPTSFKQVKKAERGGMTFRRFQADFQGKSVLITVYEEPDGKLEQYLVMAPGN